MAFSKLALLASTAAVGALAVPLSRQSAIPSYVLDYAPVVWLYSGEFYFPGAMDSQLLNTHPVSNGATITNGPSPLTLDNLADLNALGGTNVSLSSNDDFTTFPEWLNGTKPDSTGKVAGDPSCAIITTDFGNGTLQAFYMYFYPFNRGNIVFGRDAGNHVGDWEHNAIRFENGVPESVWFSQHASGEAFTYAALEKQGIRPVTYSATGSHANYAQSGDHDHTIPNLNLPFPLFLTDQTDQGTLWDPAANAYQYIYDNSTNSFTAYDGVSPTSWLTYQGLWGDEQLSQSDPRQHDDLGIALTDEWTGGPTGPDDKDLGRSNICPDGESCNIKTVKGA